MKGGIFLIDNSDQLVELTEKEYDSEEIFQTLIEKYPSILAGDQMDYGEPRRWLLISREHPIPAVEGGASRWWVDHFFIDQDSIPTFVEVKRSSDTRIRREVIGQMLEYAANAVSNWDKDEIKNRFYMYHKENNKNPEEVLMNYKGDDVTEQDLWRRAEINLEAGKIRLLFVADKIPSETRRIIEFLNDQMRNAEVFAIEIKRFVGNGFTSIVPRLIGQTQETADRKSSTKGSLNFYERLTEAYTVYENKILSERLIKLISLSKESNSLINPQSTNPAFAIGPNGRKRVTIISDGSIYLNCNVANYSNKDQLLNFIKELSLNNLIPKDINEAVDKATGRNLLSNIGKMEDKIFDMFILTITRYCLQ